MQRNWLLPLLLFIGLYIFVSQGLKGGPEIAGDELVKLLQGEPRPVLLDLRARAHCEAGHIAGALCVPAGEIKERLESLKLPKQEAVVLYGDDDARVREVTRLLYESGYQGALTLRGGVAAWRAAKQPLIEPPAAAKP